MGVRIDAERKDRGGVYGIYVGICEGFPAGFEEFWKGDAERREHYFSE